MSSADWGGKKVARIEAELKEIIPTFFKNTWEEIGSLREALKEKEWEETVARLGHSIKGSSLGYGFKGLAELGLAVEQAAREHKSPDEIEALVREIISYVEQVEIIYE